MQPRTYGPGADILFFQFSQREKDVWQIFSPDRIQEIRLILVAVRRFVKAPGIVLLFDAGVVTGCQVIKTQAARSGQQRVELQITIAVNAWVWVFSPANTRP